MHLQPTLQPDLLGRFPADVCLDITGQVGFAHRAKFSSSVGVGGGGSIGPIRCCQSAKFIPTVRGGGGGERVFWQIANSSYSRHQILSPSSGRASSDTMNCLFPSNTFLSRTYFFSKSPSQQRFVWRADILTNRSIGFPVTYLETFGRWVPPLLRVSVLCIFNN